MDIFASHHAHISAYAHKISIAHNFEIDQLTDKKREAFSPL